MIPTILIWFSLLAALVSAYSYYLSASKKRYLGPLARRAFALSGVGVLAASILLLLFIVRHQYEYSYVWSYSSNDLPLQLLVTTFWAGQEGSFMFWALCGAIIGWVLLKYTRRNHIEFETMSVYTFLQSFLLILLIAKSPFRFIWDASPSQVPQGVVPLDGRGLSPLLQNFWMIIHPPVLFIGFAAMGVPFSLAFGALWRKNYTAWIHNALPWALFASAALGAGLILGGYWAYGVLGWGGWWGWDPVENSSLIPWIIVLALVHTLLVQKKTGKLVRTNLVLAVLGFVLVVYSTFLTRSGILGEASVHSFVDPGTFVYTLLVVWILTIVALGAAMIARRWSDLAAMGERVGSLTRESMISLASVALGASALVIFFGTSWPLAAKSTVEPSFYNSMNLPIVTVLCLILGLSLLVQWRAESGFGLLRRLLGPLATALAGVALLVGFGVREASTLILAGSSIFAFAVNLVRALRLARQDPRLMGGVLSHLGIAVLLLSILASGRYDEKTTVSLPLGEKQEALGYALTYERADSLEGGKQQFRIKVEEGGTAFFLNPVMYHSSFTNGLMREPDYASFFTRDVYLEPVSLESHDHLGGIAYRLAKNQPQTIGNTAITFLKFDMTQHGSDAMVGGGGFVVGAVLEVRRGKRSEQVTAVSVFNQQASPQPKTASLKDGSSQFRLVGMNIDMETSQSSIDLEVADMTAAPPAFLKEVLVVEASVKPFMSFLWIGAFLVLAGIALALSQSPSGMAAASRREVEKDRKPTPAAKRPLREPALLEQD